MDDILIVEDDRALSQGIRLGLEGEGRRFIQTSTLDQGERALEERPFSLVVLDLNLPDGSGLELLRRLRARSALPVLILTANDLELDQVTGLELGVCPGGGRLCDQALLPGGPACPGKQPAAPRPLPQNRAGAAPLYL